MSKLRKLKLGKEIADFRIVIYQNVRNNIHWSIVDIGSFYKNSTDILSRNKINERITNNRR